MSPTTAARWLVALVLVLAGSPWTHSLVAQQPTASSGMLETLQLV